MKGPKKFSIKTVVNLALPFVAVAVAGYQVFHSGRPRNPAPAVPPPQPTPVSAVAPAPAAPATPAMPVAPAPGGGPPSPLPVWSIDRAYAETHLAEWMSSPPRDPFMQILPTPPPTHTEHFAQLTLKAIWRQDGVDMAAINNSFYRAGDTVENCKIISMEDKGVWVINNGQKEFLTFMAARPMGVPPPNGAPYAVPNGPPPPDPAVPNLTQLNAELMNAVLMSSPGVTPPMGPMNPNH